MPRISSHFRALGFGKTSAPTMISRHRCWKRLKADIKLGVAQTAGRSSQRSKRESRDRE